MPDGLIESAVQFTQPSDRRFYGVTVATVIDNKDLTGQNHVRLDIPWLPGFKPWARVAVLMAGSRRGTYFIPQKDDEVLVAFNQGDIREPYVIGSLWNQQDPAPTSNPMDATHKRIIRTPRGHQVEFDDAAQSITITTSTKQKLSMDPNQVEIEISGSAATITLDKEGTVSIKAARSIELKAPDISIHGTKKVDITSGVRTSIAGGKNCSIRAGIVNIN
jgi:uncharacterized protein involved in type VI secretion and phage assembly